MERIVGLGLAISLAAACGGAAHSSGAPTSTATRHLVSEFFECRLATIVQPSIYRVNARSSPPVEVTPPLVGVTYRSDLSKHR